MYNYRSSTSGASPDIINCTFYGNSADSYGGAIRNYLADPMIYNTIFWNDTPDEIANGGGSNPDIQHCDIQGSGSPSPWDNDPLFVNAAGEDFRLSASSPLIDEGAEFVGLTPPEDLARTTRWDRLGDGPAGLKNDVGAYEYSQGEIVFEVLDVLTSERISDAEVEVSNCHWCESISKVLPSGTWTHDGEASVDNWIRPMFGEETVRITVTAVGYADRTLFKKARPGDTLAVDLGVASADSDHDGLADAYEDAIDPQLPDKPDMKDTPDYDLDGLIDGWEENGGHWVDYPALGFGPAVFDDWRTTSELNPPPDPVRIEVVPVFFIPTDVAPSERPTAEDEAKLLAHLRLAQARYKDILKMDTFRIADAVQLYDAHSPDYYYCRPIQGNSPTRAHLMAGELLQDWGDQLDAEERIFASVYVNPATPDTPPSSWPGHSNWLSDGRDCAWLPGGGGRPFNDINGTEQPEEGGFLHVRLRWLQNGTNACGGLADCEIQSTIMHELGHTFALLHSDNRGSLKVVGENNGKDIFAMAHGPTVMSYNSYHDSKWYDGFRWGTTSSDDWHAYRRAAEDTYDRQHRGTLLEEDIYFIDTYGENAFPGLECDEIYDLDTPLRRKRIHETWGLGQMWYNGSSVWPTNDRRRLIPVNATGGMAKPDFGYELLWDGVRVGNEPFWSYSQAVSNCTWNTNTYPWKTVTCFYNGIAIDNSLIFFDGFESGDLAAWSSALP